MKLNLKIKNRSGVTLIELLIVIALIGIMSAVTIAFLGSGKNQKELESSAREVVAALREAQNLALTGKIMGTNTFPCSYVFQAVSGGSGYSINYTYHGSGQDCISRSIFDEVYAMYTLKNGVKFSTAQPNIIFSVPHATLEDNYPFVIKKGADFFSICLCATGKIVEQSGNVSNCSGMC